MGLRSGIDENLERQRYSIETTFVLRNILKACVNLSVGFRGLIQGTEQKSAAPQGESNMTPSHNTETSMGYTFDLSVN